MNRIALSLLLILALATPSCALFRKRPKEKPAQTKKEEAAPVQSSDQDFAAFVGRLRKAVDAHDAQTLAQMMTTDFAYEMGATAATDKKGEGVFQYWEENGLWPELAGIITEKFAKKDEYMVAPPQFANPAVDYEGYRAGIRRVNGSWKFAYFVTGPPQ